MLLDETPTPTEGSAQVKAVQKGSDGSTQTFPSTVINESRTDFSIEGNTTEDASDQRCDVSFNTYFGTSKDSGCYLSTDDEDFDESHRGNGDVTAFKESDDELDHLRKKLQAFKENDFSSPNDLDVERSQAPDSILEFPGSDIGKRSISTFEAPPLLKRETEESSEMRLDYSVDSEEYEEHMENLVTEEAEAGQGLFEASKSPDKVEPALRQDNHENSSAELLTGDKLRAAFIEGINDESDEESDDDQTIDDDQSNDNEEDFADSLQKSLLLVAQAMEKMEQKKALLEKMENGLEENPFDTTSSSKSHLNSQAGTTGHLEVDDEPIPIMHFNAADEADFQVSAGDKEQADEKGNGAPSADERVSQPSPQEAAPELDGSIGVPKDTKTKLEATKEMVESSSHCLISEDRNDQAANDVEAKLNETRDQLEISTSTETDEPQNPLNIAAPEENQAVEEHASQTKDIAVESEDLSSSQETEDSSALNDEALEILKMYNDAYKPASNWRSKLDELKSTEISVGRSMVGTVPKTATNEINTDNSLEIPDTDAIAATSASKDEEDDCETTLDQEVATSEMENDSAEADQSDTNPAIPVSDVDKDTSDSTENEVETEELENVTTAEIQHTSIGADESDVNPDTHGTKDDEDISESTDNEELEKDNSLEVCQSDVNPHNVLSENDEDLSESTDNEELEKDNSPEADPMPTTEGDKNISGIAANEEAEEDDSPEVEQNDATPGTGTDGDNERETEGNEGKYKQKRSFQAESVDLMEKMDKLRSSLASGGYDVTQNSVEDPDSKNEERKFDWKAKMRELRARSLSPVRTAVDVSETNSARLWNEDEGEVKNRGGPSTPESDTYESKMNNWQARVIEIERKTTSPSRSHVEVSSFDDSTVSSKKAMLPDKRGDFDFVNSSPKLTVGKLNSVGGPKIPASIFSKFQGPHAGNRLYHQAMEREKKKSANNRKRAIEMGQQNNRLNLATTKSSFTKKVATTTSKNPVHERLYGLSKKKNESKESSCEKKEEKGPKATRNAPSRIRYPKGDRNLRLYNLAQKKRALEEERKRQKEVLEATEQKPKLKLMAKKSYYSESLGSRQYELISIHERLYSLSKRKLLARDKNDEAKNRAVSVPTRRSVDLSREEEVKVNRLYSRSESKQREGRELREKIAKKNAPKQRKDYGKISAKDAVGLYDRGMMQKAALEQRRIESGNDPSLFRNPSNPRGGFRSSTPLGTRSQTPVESTRRSQTPSGTSSWRSQSPAGTSWRRSQTPVGTSWSRSQSARTSRGRAASNARTNARKSSTNTSGRGRVSTPKKNIPKPRGAENSNPLNVVSERGFPASMLPMSARLHADSMRKVTTVPDLSPTSTKSSDGADTESKTEDSSNLQSSAISIGYD